MVVKCVALAICAMGLSAVFDCGISLSYSLFLYVTMSKFMERVIALPPIQLLCCLYQLD